MLQQWQKLGKKGGKFLITSTARACVDISR